MRQPEFFINDSGGAKGADMMWDSIGREFGVTDHKHWVPGHLKSLSPEEVTMLEEDFEDAAEALGRPTHFAGVDLCKRNWLQVNRGSEGIYAISTVIGPGQKDARGFINQTSKEVVSGGTGWAVEMGIQKGMDIYVFDMKTNVWVGWCYYHNRFEETDTPTLCQHFTGIGSRFLTERGIGAIRSVYSKTFEP